MLEQLIEIVKTAAGPAFALIFAIIARSFSSIFLRYLSSGSRRTPKTAADEFKTEISEIREKISILEADKSQISLSDADRAAAKAAVKKFLINKEASTLAESIREDILSASTANIALNQIRRSYLDLLDRLRSEIDSLDRRANVNLLIGILMSALGIGLLLYYVAFEQDVYKISDRNNLIYQFLPQFATRISLVIVIEVFSYFFLRLYRTGIGDIKYFQNEITSAEFRVLALEMAHLSQSDKLLEKVTLEFAKTERNFIIKKGEHTINTINEEMQIKADRFTSDAIDRIFNKINAKDEHGNTSTAKQPKP